MNMSDEERKRIHEEAKNRMKYKGTPERPVQETPKAEDLTERFPRNAVADGAEYEVGEQESRAESAPDGKKSDRPVNLDEPGIIILYKTHKSEAISVQKEVIKKLLRERIDELTLPVGLVGSFYDYTLAFSTRDLKDQFGGIEIERVNISTKLQSLGLSCRIVKDEKDDKRTAIRISGIPSADFNEKLYFFLIHPDYRKEMPMEGEKKDEVTSFSQYPKDYVHAKPFLINPDPRSLWDDKPVADYEGYENDNDVAQGRTVPGLSLEVVAASVRGRSHAHVGKPRDDCFRMEFDEATGWNYVAVADGAGSAKFSRKGSEIACKTVINSLRESLSVGATEAIFAKRVLLNRWKTEYLEHRGEPDPTWENEFVDETQLGRIFHKAVYDAHKAIEQEATVRPALLKDYHTTLLCAAFRFVKDLNAYIIASYWVGDGGAALFANNSNAIPSWSKVIVLGEPDGGEFAGQTRFLTMPSEIFPDAIRHRLRFSFCEKIDAMLLVTDGITDPFFPSEAAVGDAKRWEKFYHDKLKNGCEEERNGCPILADATATPQQKAESLRTWLDFWSKGNHDDRTILIVKPRNDF